MFAGLFFAVLKDAEMAFTFIFCRGYNSGTKGHLISKGAFIV